ncbi:RCC1 domain-containing protein [Salipaludibacillus aurantiacus]|uniref:Regulator of chromosome condensation (RCC1) repeat-containing protein n=1 Tax=Salipaludibacillus aurantiacus TaxID=1601833 RepID=A0A1H9TV71_9BACI|nr:RCC1 domain-containing protein [Salipaludibacillus aurantiacus]SES01076.1 Regulator of chromosome condensation (RCC1) repeat-containing protein [Salipaludibacillus aurantiacus]
MGLQTSTLFAWGRNFEGQLGDGTNNDSNVPVEITSISNVIDIAGGGTNLTGFGDHSLAILEDGTVWAWGFNDFGQLGNGTNNDSNVPVQVTGLMNAINISGGFGHSLAIELRP